MKLHVRHETRYILDTPARRSVQYLRLTPRLDICQRVIDWQVNGPEHLAPWQDGLGNHCHVASESGELDSVLVHVEGTVETLDTGGVLPLDDGLPPGMFLRTGERTDCSDALAEFADAQKGRFDTEGDIAGLHGLMAALTEEIAYVSGASTVESTAAEAFENKSAVCQDHAHLFIACCRHLGVPARYISGYMSGGVGEPASHAWAEAYVDSLGWVSFDPSNAQSATAEYVRLAVGFDYGSAAPLIGLRAGGDGENMTVDVQVKQVQS